MSRRITTRVATDLFIGPYHVEYAAGSALRYDEYRLRYRVFVEEREYLPQGVMPDGLERDEFDNASCSVLLRDAASGEAVACQRLILPERLPDGARTNVERFAADAGIRLCRLSSGSWAEVSRSTIASKYRWGGAATPTLPAMKAVTYASAALAVALNRHTLFSMSDPRIARLTRRLGFEPRAVAGPFDFHGVRELFSIDVDEVLRTVPGSMHTTMDDLVAEAFHLLDSGW